MTHGGVRPGSGRPKGKISQKTARSIAIKELFTRRVQKEAKPLLDALIDAAKGHLAIDHLRQGRKVYEKAPVPEAAKYLFDQAMGRATESMKLIGKNGGGVVIIKLPEKEPIDIKRVIDMGTTTEASNVPHKV